MISRPIRARRRRCISGSTFECCRKHDDAMSTPANQLLARSFARASTAVDLQHGALSLFPLRRSFALWTGRCMGLCSDRRPRRADLLERTPRCGIGGHRCRGFQRILRFADGDRSRLQSGRLAADVERDHVVGDRGVRRSVGGRHLPHDARRLADSRVCAVGGHGGHLLRGASDPLGVPRPWRVSDCVVVWTVDGARQRLPLHRCRFVGRVLRIAGAGISHHGAGGRQRDSRFPSGSPGRQTQPGRPSGQEARRLALCGLGGSRSPDRAGRALRRVCFLPPALPRFSRCRFSWQAGAVPSLLTRRRGSSCPPFAASCAAISLR